MTTPEQRASKNIDDLLTACGWAVQSRDRMNLGAGRGVAVREFPMKGRGHPAPTGFADYALFVDRRIIGAVAIGLRHQTPCDHDPRATVESFRQFLADHRDEITALQIIYGQPYSQRALTFQQVKELAEALWLAFVQLERDKVRGVGAKRVLTDVVSLVRHAVQLDDELIPYPDRVRTRYAEWIAAQEASGHTFTAEQRWWLDKVAEHIGVNVSIAPDDLNYGEFFNKGGRIAAARVFGQALPALLDELNAALT
jgi:hypothetical protein